MSKIVPCSSMAAPSGYAASTWRMAGNGVCTHSPTNDDRQLFLNAHSFSITVLHDFQFSINWVDHNNCASHTKAEKLGISLSAIFVATDSHSSSVKYTGLQMGRVRLVVDKAKFSILHLC